MLDYDISAAHRLVRQQQAIGVDVRWDGWDLVFFRPAEQGMYSTDGAFRNGVWGFDNRIVVNSQGKWSVDPRNIKRPRRPRAKS